MGEFLDYIYQGFKYKLYVPRGYKTGKKTPLMVMLHGCDQDPDDFAAGTDMNNLAERENFLVLYPNMNHLLNPSDPAGYNPFGCWNWFLDKNQHRGQGHPRLINEIIEEVKRGYSIHTNKVYAAGLSAGGSLACILGVTYPDVFAAIGICSGLAYDAANVFFLTDPLAEDAKKSMEKGVPDPYACGNNAYQEMGEFKKKMSVIVFHGISDTTVHPINGQQVITQWAQTNFLVEDGKGTADVSPTSVNAGSINGKSYTQHIYCDQKGDALLELWMIDQMGHAWSGGSTNGSYTDPAGPNATEIIWNFFKKKRVTKKEKLAEAPVETTVSHLPAPTWNPSVSDLISSSLDKSAMAAQDLHSDEPILPSQELHPAETANPLLADTTMPSPLQAKAEELPDQLSISSPDIQYLEAPFQKTVDLPSKAPRKRLFRTLLEKLKKRNKKGAS